MAPSIYALQSMIKPDPHRAALNPENLDAYDRPRHDRIKMTMEFRQQKAFIDADEVLPWVDFVVSVVKFAARSDGPAILEHCLTECANANPSIEPFLTGLGVSPATIDFYLQRADQCNDAMVAVAQAEDARTDAFGPGHPLTDSRKL